MGLGLGLWGWKVGLGACISSKGDQHLARGLRVGVKGWAQGWGRPSHLPQPHCFLLEAGHCIMEVRLSNPRPGP